MVKPRIIGSMHISSSVAIVMVLFSSPEPSMIVEFILSSITSHLKNISLYSIQSSPKDSIMVLVVVSNRARLVKVIDLSIRRFSSYTPWYTTTVSPSIAASIPSCIVIKSSGTVITAPKPKDSNNIVSSFFISPPICMIPIEFRAFYLPEKRTFYKEE